MSKIVTLSLLQSRSLFKEKATYLFGVMASVIIVLSLGLSSAEIGAKHKLFEDILLTSQGYFFLLAALFYAFTQSSRDRNLGLFVLPVANGMKRREYLVAQMLSLGWIISLLALLFLSLDLIALAVVEGRVDPLLLWQVFLYALSSLLVAYMVMAFGQYVSLTNALLYSVAFFVIGHGLDELYIYTKFVAETAYLTDVMPLLYYLLPNFSLFDRQSTIVNRQALDVWGDVLLPLLYFSVWTLMLFLAALVKFQKKGLTIGN